MQGQNKLDSSSYSLDGRQTIKQVIAILVSQCPDSGNKGRYVHTQGTEYTGYNILQCMKVAFEEVIMFKLRFKGWLAV